MSTPFTSPADVTWPSDLFHSVPQEATTSSLVFTQDMENYLLLLLSFFALSPRFQTDLDWDEIARVIHVNGMSD